MPVGPGQTGTPVDGRGTSGGTAWRRAARSSPARPSALDLRLAGLPSRLLARLLDVLAQLALAARPGPGRAGPRRRRAPTPPSRRSTIVAVVLVVVGYPVALETLLRGRTLGKLALGLRVVRDDGGPVGFRQALVRGLAGVIEPGDQLRAQRGRDAGAPAQQAARRPRRRHGRGAGAGERARRHRRADAAAARRVGAGAAPRRARRGPRAVGAQLPGPQRPAHRRRPRGPRRPARRRRHGRHLAAPAARHPRLGLPVRRPRRAPPARAAAAPPARVRPAAPAARPARAAVRPALPAVRPAARAAAPAVRPARPARPATAVRPAVRPAGAPSCAPPTARSRVRRTVSSPPCPTGGGSLRPAGSPRRPDAASCPSPTDRRPRARPADRRPALDDRERQRPRPGTGQPAAGPGRLPADDRGPARPGHAGAGAQHRGPHAAGRHAGCASTARTSTGPCRRCCSSTAAAS